MWRKWTYLERHIFSLLVRISIRAFRSTIFINFLILIARFLFRHRHRIIEEWSNNSYEISAQCENPVTVNDLSEPIWAPSFLRLSTNWHKREQRKKWKIRQFDYTIFIAAKLTWPGHNNKKKKNLQKLTIIFHSIYLISFQFGSVDFNSFFAPFVSMPYRERYFYTSCPSLVGRALAVSRRSRHTNEIHLKIEIKLNRQAINTNECRTVR